MKLEMLNRSSEADFLHLIGGPLEGETWLAERVFPERPFENVEMLYQAFADVVQQHTSSEEKIKLIASHPDLAGKLQVLSPMSVAEQSAAGLNRLSEEEYATFSALNLAYKTQFGFPFVICARENTKDTILASFRERLQHSREQEIDLAIGEVLKILKLRLIDQFKG